MIKKTLSEVISLRKEILRLRDENLRLKVKLERLKVDEQSSKKRDILLSLSITALLAVVAYTFNFFFDEILSYKVSVEDSNLQLCYVTQSPDSDMIKFYILLGSIIGIGAISSYLWRRK